MCMCINIQNYVFKVTCLLVRPLPHTTNLQPSTLTKVWKVSTINSLLFDGYEHLMVKVEIAHL